MLSTKTSNALTGVSKATLKQGVRIKHLFRIMTHCPDLWMKAYANIYANDGATTKGTDDSTMDGMCQDRIQNLIQLLKDGRYQPRPARRTYIPKKNGKMRPLGVPGGDDKLVQEVARILLEGIYEPGFSQHSHGFRPKRSCHTSLQDIVSHWKGVKWAVDMDIQAFFDNIDHEILIGCLERKIDDRKFIELIRQMLQAGYLENWKFHGTYSGTPQGGIISPILANVVLHELDEFMRNKQRDFSRGHARQRNHEYELITKRIVHYRKRIDLLRSRGAFDFMVEECRGQIKKLEDERSGIAPAVMDDENFRRFHYVRYADDFVVGLISSKEEAEHVYNEIEQFLRERLKLDISREKSGIRHIKDGFDFLGYHISLDVNNERRKRQRCGKTKDGRNTYGVRSTVKAQLFLQVPKEKVWQFCRKAGYLQGKYPESRPWLLQLSDYEIVATYNAEMRGFANYYALAPKRNLGILEWAGLESLFKTLAHKHRTSSYGLRCKMKVGDEHLLRYEHKGQQRAMRIFKIKHRTEVPKHIDRVPNTNPFANVTSELLQRMQANQCEYCGKTGGYFEIHHIRKLKDVRAKKKKARWELRMIARNRKTMVLCRECHDLLHAGHLQGWKQDAYTEMESVVHRKVPAAFGGGRTSSPSNLDAWVANKPISD